MGGNMFAAVEAAHPSNEVTLEQTYKADRNPKKMNLASGLHLNSDLEPLLLPVVRRVSRDVARTNSHGYLPALGNEDFRYAATEFLLGSNAKAIKHKRAFSVQTLGKTGAFRLGAQFLHDALHRQIVYCSDPTVENYSQIFTQVGYSATRYYRYWDHRRCALHIEGMIADLTAAPPDSIVVMYACGHNPTGIDPSHAQWAQIADIIETKHLFPFFDTSFQGFVSGEPDVDAWAVRYFVDRGFELFCAQSFSRKFGFYGERVGSLTVVQKTPNTTEAVSSRLAELVSVMYSSPPLFGSQVVATILRTQSLYNEWKDNFNDSLKRINKIRDKFIRQLSIMKTPGQWAYIEKQNGMFLYMSLSERQMRFLIEGLHIYHAGRFNLSALDDAGVERLAKAIHSALDLK